MQDSLLARFNRHLPNNVDIPTVKWLWLSLFLISACFLDKTQASFNDGVFASYLQSDPISQLPTKVTQVRVDAFGRVWFSSPDGFYQYHGNAPVKINFSHDQVTLQGKTVRDFQITADDHIWLLSDKTLWQYDPSHHQVTTVIEVCADCELLDIEVIANELWLGSNKGLIQLTAPDTVHNQQQTLSEHTVFDIKAMDAKTLLVATEAGVFKVNKDTLKAEVIPSDFTQATIVSNILAVDQQFWLATDQGLGLLKSTLPHRVTKIPSVTQGLYSVQKNINNQLLLGTIDQGILSFDPKTRIAKKQVFLDSRHRKNLNPIAYNITKDPFHNLWFATANSGLIKLNPNQQAIHYSTGLIKDDAAWRVFCSLETHNKTVLLGSYSQGMAAFYNYSDKKIIHKPARSSKKVLSLLEDSRKRIWVGTAGGLGYLDPLIETFTPYPDTNIDNKSVFALFEDSKARIWVGFYEGLAAIKKNGTRSFSNELDTLYAGKNKPRFFTSINEDNAQNIWIGTNAGLLYYNDSSQKLDPIATTKDRWITHINHQQNQLWLATDNGLFTFTLDSHRLAPYQPDTIKGNVIATYWHNNTLWIITRNAIFYAINNAKQLRKISLDSGLMPVHFNYGASSFSNAILYIGSDQGLVTLDTTIANAPLPQAKTYIPSITFDGSDDCYTLSSSAPVPTCYVKDKADLVAINFSLNDLRAPKSNQYRYRINSTAWSAWHQTNQLTLGQLASGTHYFEAQGKTADAQAADSFAINIVVPTPLWLTPLAYTGYGILFVLLNLAFYQLRMRAIRSSNKKLEQLVNDRTQTLHTKNQKIEQQAKDLNKLVQLKDAFFADVTHELKTPISLMLGPLELLAREISSKQGKNLLSTAQNNGILLLNTINQLLDFERYRFDKTDASSLCLISLISHQVIEGFETAINEKNLQLDIDIKPNIYASITAEGAEKIIANLLSNAIKYTPDSGSIWFSMNDAENTVSLSIKDSGSGIPIAMQNSIFERFTRLEEHRQIAGSGIGLAIVKQIANHFGGEVKFTTPTEGGAEFIITLPKAMHSPQQLDLTSSQHTNVDVKRHFPFKDSDKNVTVNDQLKSSHNAAKILIIEDNQELAKLIALSLQDDFQIKLSHDGKQGLQEALTWLPDLVISDLMLPALDGFTVCQRLKQHKLTMHIPIIIITAKSDMQTKFDAHEHLADAFLEKPFHWQQLNLQVKNLLETRSRIARQWGLMKLSRVTAEQSAFEQMASHLISSKDKEQLEKLQDCINQHYSDSDFKAEQLAEKIGSTRRTLDRHTKRLVGVSATELIRIIRLEKAKALVIKGNNLTSVAYEVGFSSQGHFSSSFKDYFGLSPKEMQKAPK